MTTYFAFLRGINVGGKKPVGMAGLRAMAESLGFSEVRTLLQSGNLIFSGDVDSDGALERRLEAEAKRLLGLETDFMVRRAAEIQRVIASNPFPEAARDDPGHLVVSFLKSAPAAGALEALRAAIAGRESVELAGRDLFILYPDGIGRSKLTSALMDKRLATRGTGRNWNTVLKLADLAHA